MGFGIFELFFVLCVLFGLCSCCRKIYNEDSSNYTQSSCENQNVSVAIAASLATYYEEIEETLEKFGRKPANQFIYYQENIECPICIEKIEADDFPVEIRRPNVLTDRYQTTAEKPYKRKKLTREDLLGLLEECEWNKAEVGRRVGLSRTAIWKYMKKWQIPLQREA